MLFLVSIVDIDLLILGLYLLISSDYSTVLVYNVLINYFLNLRRSTLFLLRLLSLPVLSWLQLLLIWLT